MNVTAKSRLEAVLTQLPFYFFMELACQLIIIFTIPTGPSRLTTENALDFSQPLSLIFIGVIKAPLLEELVFRGALFNVLRFVFGKVVSSFTPQGNSWALYSAIALSSIAFGLAHQELYFGIFLMHTVFGAFAAHLYYRTGTIFAPIALHMLNNAMPVSALLLIEFLK
jgi:membrane protease YdiL (CAAX protease family)